MKNIYSLVVTILFVGIVFSLVFAQETLTISTYYPSPYGSYNELQLNPHASPVATCDANGKGTVYYDLDNDTIYMCNGVDWNQAIGSWARTTGTNNISNTNTGNVGIGTTTPAQKLDVNGNARVSGSIFGPAGGNGGKLMDRGGDNGFSVDWTGPPYKLDFYIDTALVGTMTMGKTFVIDNPLDKDKYLVHATLEGPEVGVYYRGTAKLTKGIIEIILPPYFEALTSEESRTVILTNIDGFDRLAVKKQGGKKISDGKFTVVSDNPNSSQEFDWEVKAIRKDIAPLVVEPDKKKTKVAGFGPYTYIESK